MKTGFYAKIATGNLRKNSRFFFPHMLTGAGLLACCFIIYSLKMDGRLSSVKGGNYIPTFMSIGLMVISMLSFVLMLFTNSFLMKRRKQEFGLYNVLGMEKRHIGRILFYETLISGACSIVVGLIFGIVFYKFCSLVICNLLRVSSVVGFYYIRPNTIIPPVLYFMFLYLFTYVINRISIRRMKPVEMLAGGHTGEKEPRIKWVFLLVGIAALGTGYFIALTTQSPLRALSQFFTAVLLVIIGTYCLFIAGTIAILKFLKRRKKYYYNKKHMVAVSGLLYRMKQNAVGLASITILATCVMVSISTTVSLYAGIDDTATRNYPQQLYLSASIEDYTDGEEKVEIVGEDKITEWINRAAANHNVGVEAIRHQRFLNVSYCFRDGELLMETDKYSLDEIVSIIYLSCEYYNALTGNDISLADDEIILANYELSHNYEGDAITVDGKTFRIKDRVTYFPIKSEMSNSTKCYGIVLPSEAALDMIYEGQLAGYGENRASQMTDRYTVSYTDRSKADAVGYEMENEIKEYLSAYAQEKCGETATGWSIYTDSSWDAMAAMLGMYGTILFLGLILGFVFLFATALIIYYKQISEGYDDRERFQIMEKIGMSSAEVKKTIRSQILLVFFLPLFVALVHVLVDFPLMTKLLKLILLSNESLFLICTLITFAVFAIIYVAIYVLTAKIYYKIVH